MWVVSAWEAIQWMRNPTPQAQMTEFKEWKTCEEQIPIQKQACNIPSVCKLFSRQLRKQRLDLSLCYLGICIMLTLFHPPPSDTSTLARSARTPTPGSRTSLGRSFDRGAFCTLHYYTYYYYACLCTIFTCTDKEAISLFIHISK